MRSLSVGETKQTASSSKSPLPVCCGISSSAVDCRVQLQLHVSPDARRIHTSAYVSLSRQWHLNPCAATCYLLPAPLAYCCCTPARVAAARSARLARAMRSPAGCCPSPTSSLPPQARKQHHAARRQLLHAPRLTCWLLAATPFLSIPQHQKQAAPLACNCPTL